MTDKDIIRELVEGWPENIVADRHEVSGKWVLWYLTDAQAEVAKAALARAEKHLNGKGE